MFRFGADYYPEQWPEERWPEDARLMAEAGLNVVRLAEFAWAKMEPADGEFDFDWLDRAIQILHEHGISVILGTPTASPPAWLARKHPEILRVRSDGLRVDFGFRRINCPSHPVYREYGRRITSCMAEHYRDHPALLGWQIDNEFGDRCYCPVCQAEFQNWLKRRYGTLENLNEHWGTDFWSQTYFQWSEIPLPLSTPGGPPNPGLALDYRRFISDTYVSFQQEQIDILHKESPGRFITHNLMGFGYDGLDYFDLAASLDFVSWDNYPFGFWHKEDYQPAMPALNHAAIRGLKNRNFWVMEQQAGPSGWETLSPSPRPGQLRSWAYQSIAHGADGMVFFRWRTARYGTEQYWHGLLEHDGRAGRRYAEIKQMGLELRRAGERILGSTVRSQVAILQSYDARFAFQIQSNSPQFSYERHLSAIYRALWNKRVAVDMVSPSSDLSNYSLVIVPALHVLTDEIAEHLKQYVSSGGMLVVTPRSGVKDNSNAIVNLPLPGLLADLCGATVDEYDAIPPEMQQSVTFAKDTLAGQSFPVHTWCDVLSPKTAVTAATYDKEYYANRPAVTINNFDAGRVVYLGAFGGESFLGPVFDWLFSLIRIKPLMDVPAGVEVAERWQGQECLRFLLNHTDEIQIVSLDRPCLNLLGGAQLNGRVRMEPFGVLILSSVSSNSK